MGDRFTRHLANMVATSQGWMDSGRARSHLESVLEYLTLETMRMKKGCLKLVYSGRTASMTKIKIQREKEDMLQQNTN